MAFGGGLEPQQDMMTELNMTPLVDVMLVLLILFMITMPLLTQAVVVNLPTASEQPVQTDPEVVVLSVDKDGLWYWQQDLVTEQQMQQRLLQAAAQQPVLHLQGDKDVPYQHMVRLMALVQQAGIEQLGFVTVPAD
ncbi:biopolymer transporter ExbD [Alkalimonas sp. NCh-2]|uniref:ExbD/TolR family protein n=1 Tax=Alkalimonas sp. NCh-2 TaxID=3144846 RepID=UPI0031F65B45